MCDLCDKITSLVEAHVMEAIPYASTSTAEQVSGWLLEELARSLVAAFFRERDAKHEGKPSRAKASKKAK
jgi:hypothetical protein